MIKIYLSSPVIPSKQHPLYQLYRSLKDFGYEVLGYQQNEYATREFLINSCDIFIAYLVDKNSNVIFEVGYAKALGKNILLLADKDEEIPYGLKNCSFIKIDGNLSNQTYRILSYLETLSPVKGKKIAERPANYEEFFTFYKANPLIIDKINSLDFEYYIFKFLQDLKFGPENADLTKGIDDYIFLNDYKSYSKTLIEIKKYDKNNKVSVNAVQYLHNSMIFHNADHGILITSSSFTPSAKDFVESLDDSIK
jgi:hypothetical protein